MLPFQPEGLPEGSRRSKQRGDLPVCGETSTHPNGGARELPAKPAAEMGTATTQRCRRRENSGTPLGCMLFCQRFPEVSATLRPPATIWHRFAVRDGAAYRPYPGSRCRSRSQSAVAAALCRRIPELPDHGLDSHPDFGGFHFPQKVPKGGIKRSDLGSRFVGLEQTGL